LQFYDPSILWYNIVIKIQKQKMKQHIDTKLGVTIILIFAITVGAFVWKWEKNSGDAIISSDVYVSVKNKSIKNEQAAKIVVDDALDSNIWREYTDEKSGYAVQYPAGYVVKKYDSPCYNKLDDKDGQNILIQSNDLVDGNSKAYENYIDNGMITDFNVFMNDPNDKCIRNAYSSIGGPEAQVPKLIKSENIKIDGRDVLKREYVHLNPEGKESSFHFSTWRFNEGNQYYTLSYNNGVRIFNLESENELFLKFLDSFKVVKK